MNDYSLEEDPVLGQFFDTPEKKARWIYRLRIAYIAWIILVVLGITSIALWHLMK